MTSFSYIDDIYMDENDMDDDTKIINFIAERVYVRPKEVIAKFAREDQKKRRSKKDNGTNKDKIVEIGEIVKEDFNETVKEDPKGSESKEVDLKASEEDKISIRTIYRRLEKLKEVGGPIIEVTENQLIRYGITTEDRKKTDGRAKYLTLRGTIERDKDLDEIFRRIKGDNIDKGMVLREINRSKDYILLPSQLDDFVSNLNIEDPKLTEGFLSILYQYITKKEIKPQKKKILLKKLKGILEKYPEGHEKYALIRTYTIDLLGHYDKAVIEQLTKDCKKGRLSKFKEDYYGWNTAKAIKEARKELFNLENELRREGDTVTADALADLRDKAEEILKTQEEKDELLKSGNCETGEKTNLGKFPNYFHMLQN